ncbi:MAG TPA: hypothetical protein VJ862_02585 [Rhodanobacteraceae bacterium]|nr:hypothetical protein [Rhodanobacteraceae bacterium]
MNTPFDIAIPDEGRSIEHSGRRFWREVTSAGQVPRDVATHEAGHAIAAWWTGKGIAKIVVRPVGEPGLNFTEAERCYIEGHDEASVAAFRKRLTRKQLNDRVFRELVQCMAGPMAEAKLKGYGFAWQAMAMDPGYRHWREGDPPSDLHAWKATADLPKPKDKARVANGSIAVCAHLLAFYWEHVETLATALQERHALTGADVLTVTGEAPRGPLCALTLGATTLTL